jgi:hypothetical protein
MKKTAWVLLFGLLAVLCALAAGDSKGKGKGHGQGKGASAAPGVDVRFAPAEVRVIHEFYQAHPSELPPGLQKKLARTGTLPPGWQKKLRPFPDAIDSRLPPLCDYCGRGVMDGYGVIYDKRTRVILDIVQLVGDVLR